MKAPDKIYVGVPAGVLVIASNTRTFDSDIEYIRKDAIIQEIERRIAEYEKTILQPHALIARAKFDVLVELLNRINEL